MAPRVNIWAGGAVLRLTSGSLNASITQSDPHKRRTESYRTRGSASYMTGSHNAKIGYEGGYFTKSQTNMDNDPQMTYTYNKPETNCVTSTNPLACGQCCSLQFPKDPFNRALRPVPVTSVHTGTGTIQDQVMYASLYVQDQWTLKRFTLSGALRFDHATSGYGETCIGPNQFVPIQANGDNFYRIPETDGVSYNDITPRWGVAWDMFGTGERPSSGTWASISTRRTSVASTRRQSGAAHVQYARAQLERRQRRPRCRLRHDELPPNGECGAFAAPGARTDTTRYRRTTRFGRIAPVEPGRPRNHAVRPNGAGHSRRHAGLLQPVRRIAARGMGKAPFGMAVRHRRPARDPAATLGRDHL